MKRILVIAVNTFREAIRDKILYSLLFFSSIIMVASLAFGALSVREDARLTADLGLGGMSLFLVAIAIFIGVNLVYKELERRTVYTILPKGIHRYHFILGKFGGLSLTLIVLATIMSLVLISVLLVQGSEIHLQAAARMVILIVLEGLVITSIAVFFSSFSTPFLSGMFSFGIFLIGRSVPEIRAAAARMGEPILRGLLNTFAAVVPNLRYFFVSGSEIAGAHTSIHESFIDWSYVATAARYGAFYMAIVLLFAALLFSRRDFI